MFIGDKRLKIEQLCCWCEAAFGTDFGEDLDASCCISVRILRRRLPNDGDTRTLARLNIASAGEFLQGSAYGGVRAAKACAESIFGWNLRLKCVRAGFDSFA